MRGDFVKKGLVLGIIVLFVGVSIGPSVISEECERIPSVARMLTTWVVDDEGDGDFTSIQEAIDNDSVQDDDTIEVYSGTYIENVVVDKSINLVGKEEEYLPNGNDTGKPVINGSGGTNVVYIIVNGVTISNFNITNAVGNLTDYGVGIKVISDYNKILMNEIRNNEQLGIYSNNNYENNISFNTISDNVIGIYCREISGSKIYNNSISGNEVGVLLEGGDDIDVRKNIINNCKSLTISTEGTGIVLICVTGVIVIENRLNHNELGIACSGNTGTFASSIVIVQNIFSHNDLGFMSEFCLALSLVFNDFLYNNLSIQLYMNFLINIDSNNLISNNTILIKSLFSFGYAQFNYWGTSEIISPRRFIRPPWAPLLCFPYVRKPIDTSSP